MMSGAGMASKLSCLLLAFCLDVVKAVAPTQQVTNVRFEDTNDLGGWLSGTIHWDPPADTTGVSKYAVLIFNSMADVTPALPELPGDFDGAWYLCALGGTPGARVGTNSLDIKTLFDAQFPRRGSEHAQPQNRRRYVWAGGRPPDRYLAVVCVNDQQENGPLTVIPLYDKSRQKPFKHLGSASFTDTNAYDGVIAGKVTWPVTLDGDFTLTKSYSVFLANDEEGTNEIQVGSTDVPTWELEIFGHRANRDWIRIVAVNPNGVSTWAVNHRLFDLGQSVPQRGVTSLAFVDTDPRTGLVAGNVTWTPPDDEGAILSYKVFLSDQPGVGGVVYPEHGYEVPVGTNFFMLPVNMLRNAKEAGDPDYLQVYAANDKGMQALPTEIAIEDRTEV